MIIHLNDLTWRSWQQVVCLFFSVLVSYCTVIIISLLTLKEVYLSDE